MFTYFILNKKSVYL